MRRSETGAPGRPAPGHPPPPGRETGQAFQEVIAMKLSPKSRIVTSFCISFAALQLARADMGTVWVEEVKADSITINWSDPSGIHRLDQGAQEFRVSWELVRQYPEDSPEGSTLPEDRYPR